MAQQVQVEKHSKTPLAYPEFRDGAITFTFGTTKTYKADIFLKDASLIYKSGGKTLKASLAQVRSVTFGTDSFIPTGGRLGRVIAAKDSVTLTDVTTIDMARIEKDVETGKNSSFLDMPEFNVFIDTNSDYWGRDDSYIPLKTEYFFVIKGEAVPATEKVIKQRIRPDKKKDFKELMKNRFWSWKDAGSLKQLLEYF
jgi:hypothetical protein